MQISDSLAIERQVRSCSHSPSLTERERDDRRETVSLRADSGRPLRVGPRPVRHDPGTAARLCHLVRVGCWHGVRGHSVEPVPVLPQGRYGGEGGEDSRHRSRSDVLVTVRVCSSGRSGSCVGGRERSARPGGRRTRWRRRKVQIFEKIRKHFGRVTSRIAGRLQSRSDTNEEAPLRVEEECLVVQ